MNKSKKNINDSVILNRVSKTYDEDLDLSLKAQGALLTNYSKKEGFPERETFTIKERASEKSQRNQFNEMMDFVRRNDIKHIIVEKVDRLTRNYKDMVMIDDWLEEDNERKVHFVKDSIILHKRSKSHDKLNWGVRVLIAKNFIDNLREEVEKGVHQKLEDRWLPGTPPPGYINIGKEGQRTQVINPKVAPLVQKMFELYLEPHQSLSTLTKEMEERGLTSRFGRPLSRTHIRKLLTNRFYIGELWWDAKAYGKGNHVAIIKKTVFDMVKNKLESKNIPKRRKHNTLFKGLITCEECSSIITWELHKGTYYGRCKGYRNCSRKTYAKQHEIEQELLNRFETLLAPSPDIAEWTKEAIKLRHENDMAAYYATMNRMKERHTDLARRIDVAYDDRADGRITVEKYDSKVELWETEQEAILEQLSSFDDTYHARLAHNLNVLELSQRANEIYQSKTSVEDRRALLGELFSNLTLNGPSLSVEYHETVKFIAQKAEKSRALKKSFELDNNGSTKQNILRENAQKDIWLRR